MNDIIFSKEEREILDEILDKQERTRIQYFVEDEELFEAVRKVLLIPMYNYGTLKKGKKSKPYLNWAMNYLGNNNENLGASVRACASGIDFMERGLALLTTLKKQKEIKVENENPAI